MPYPIRIRSICTGGWNTPGKCPLVVVRETWWVVLWKTRCWRLVSYMDLRDGIITRIMDYSLKRTKWILNATFCAWLCSCASGPDTQVLPTHLLIFHLWLEIVSQYLYRTWCQYIWPINGYKIISYCMITCRMIQNSCKQINKLVFDYKEEKMSMKIIRYS